MGWFTFSWQNFWFSFLALAFEGLPFVFIGALVSGGIAAFVPARLVARVLPRNPVLATLCSGLLGIFFPICECGVVPVVRRLVDKGLPLSCGVAYMLASPIVNPIVAFSTYAAFRGQSPLLVMITRLVSGYAVAVLAGLAVSRVPAEAITKVGALRIARGRRAAFRIAAIPEEEEPGIVPRLIGAVQLTCDDFIDTAMYFMVGAAVAATFNTAVDQKVILPLASNTVLATGAMMIFSLVLTLCSTSDAFIAATFASIPMVARAAFMIFGPMFDLKLLFLYSALFNKRFVCALGISLFLLVGAVCLIFLAPIFAAQHL